MRVHVVADFMHVFYEYFFGLKYGKQKKLTSIVPEGYKLQDGEKVIGVGEEFDISMIYYTIRALEGFKKNALKMNDALKPEDIILSICFDSRVNTRKDKDEGYKSKRTSNITSKEASEIEVIKQVLLKAGHNIYEVNGAEADDIVHSLCEQYHDSFDATIVYTNDADLLVNVREDVVVMRKKARSGQKLVTKDNYEAYLYNEYKANIPYNSIILYKSIVGDISDGIRGIKGIGANKFNKYIEYLKDKGIDFSLCSNPGEVGEIIQSSIGYLGEGGIMEALESLELVKAKDIGEIGRPVRVSTEETRILAYEPFKMYSLLGMWN